MPCAAVRLRKSEQTRFVDQDAVSPPTRARTVDLSLDASLDISADARDFDPDDSGSDFEDELPALTQARSPQRRLEGEDAIAEAEKRTCESHLCRRARARAGVRRASALVCPPRASAPCVACCTSCA